VADEDDYEDHDLPPPRRPVGFAPLMVMAIATLVVGFSLIRLWVSLR
jgi:hypothetical protein